MTAPNYFHPSHNPASTTSCVHLICSCIHDCLRHMREYHYYDPYFMRRSIADALFVYLVFFIFIDCAHQKSFSFGSDLSHMCFFYLRCSFLCSQRCSFLCSLLLWNLCGSRCVFFFIWCMIDMRVCAGKKFISNGVQNARSMVLFVICWDLFRLYIFFFILVCALMTWHSLTNIDNISNFFILLPLSSVLWLIKIITTKTAHPTMILICEIWFS